MTNTNLDALIWARTALSYHATLHPTLTAESISYFDQRTAEIATTFGESVSTSMLVVSFLEAAARLHFTARFLDEQGNAKEAASMRRGIERQLQGARRMARLLARPAVDQ